MSSHAACLTDSTVRFLPPEVVNAVDRVVHVVDRSGLRRRLGGPRGRPKVVYGVDTQKKETKGKRNKEEITGGCAARVPQG